MSVSQSEGRIARLRQAFEDKSQAPAPALTGDGLGTAASNVEDHQLVVHPPRPDTPTQVQSGDDGSRPPQTWGDTLEGLERAGKDGNLSGIVSATSRALKAALMEREELNARNAELEAKLASVAGVGDTDAGEIERALSDASNALAERRQEILLLQEQIAAVQTENQTMREAQARLQTIMAASDPEGKNGLPAADEFAGQLKLQAADIVKLRNKIQHLESENRELHLICADSETQRDTLQLQLTDLRSQLGTEARCDPDMLHVINDSMFNRSPVGLATISEGESSQNSPTNSSPVSVSDASHSASEEGPLLLAVRRELEEERLLWEADRQEASRQTSELQMQLDAAYLRVQELEAVTTSTMGGVKRPDTEHEANERAGGDDQQATLRQELEASQGELKALREEAVLLRQRAQTLASAHEHMREKLAQSADGLSERMQEARQGRRELEQASLTIMQMDAKIRLLSSAKGQTDEKVDIRIARERVMMHEALDRMRSHMSEVLDAQRRDAARDLKTLREDMTQQVLLAQMAKEEAEEKLGLLLAQNNDRMAASTGAPATATESEMQLEIANLRASLAASLQQQQALADFWSLEKQRFEAMEQHVKELSTASTQEIDDRVPPQLAQHSQQRQHGNTVNPATSSARSSVQILSYVPPNPREPAQQARPQQPYTASGGLQQ